MRPLVCRQTKVGDTLTHRQIIPTETMRVRFLKEGPTRKLQKQGTGQRESAGAAPFFCERSQFHTPKQIIR